MSWGGRQIVSRGKVPQRLYPIHICVIYSLAVFLRRRKHVCRAHQRKYFCRALQKKTYLQSLELCEAFKEVAHRQNNSHKANLGASQSRSKQFSKDTIVLPWFPWNSCWRILREFLILFYELHHNVNIPAKSILDACWVLQSSFQHAHRLCSINFD